MYKRNVVLAFDEVYEIVVGDFTRDTAGLVTFAGDRGLSFALVKDETGGIEPLVGQRVSFNVHGLMFYETGI